MAPAFSTHLPKRSVSLTDTYPKCLADSETYKSRSPIGPSISQPEIFDTSCAVYAPDWYPYWPFFHRKRGPTDFAVTKTLTRKAHDTTPLGQGTSRFNFRLCPHNRSQ
jgi:hypothetical protein